MSGSAENCPCPAGRRFCKQAWCPPSLAGVSAGQRGAHATCAVCPHAPHWLRCCLRAKWLLLMCVYVLGVSMCKVFLRCRDARSAWRDDFRRLAEVRCRTVTRPGLARQFSLPSCAPAVTVSVVYPSLLQPRWFTRMPQWKNSFPMAIPTALMRGHTHAQEGLPLLPTGIRVPREHAMRREGTPGSAKAQIRGHRSIAVGMPRADDSPNALRSPQRSSTGGRESRGHQRRPGRLVQQRTVPPSRPLKRCIDVLCQFLSGGQGARARSDAWVLDSVFFVTASTVVG